MSSVPVRLPATLLQRPERQRPKSNWLDKTVHWLAGIRRYSSVVRHWGNKRLLKDIHRQAVLLSEKEQDALGSEASRLRGVFLHDGHSRDYLVKVFALVREVSGRTLGMYHFDSQLLGGLALYYGNIAEMQTGEGKTLTAILPAAAAALGGVPVHIITVNDYLASRDAALMKPAYEMLGLSVSCVIHEMTREERQEAYACDVVYCTNKELVFDYLKDHLILKDYDHSLQLYGSRLLKGNDLEKQLMLRGLHYAIVDEADSVLLDEARSPLVISGTVAADEEQDRVYHQALQLASGLEQDTHFVLNTAQRSIDLLQAGEQLIVKESRELGAFWAGRIRRNELIHKALTALYLFERDQHYIIVEGKVQIVDEHTGRIMADRSWEQGLHQLIETKESCELTSPRDTLARISYQRFFRLYHHLSGMTGTGSEVAGELWQIYGLLVTSISLHQPSRRKRLPIQIFSKKAAKWQAVVTRIEALSRDGHPILIGTASVAESEFLSELLQRKNIAHQLLNARNDTEEADIITAAGTVGQITVATSMAGRGTDIKLSGGAREKGGLHVLLTEYHDASRIDRQLEGRCARQGDPGCFEVFVSLEDSLLKKKEHSRQKSSRQLSKLARKTGLKKLKAAQRHQEKQHVTARKELFRQDEQRSEMLAFTNNGL